MIILGDSLEVLKTLDADSVDAVVTDPPYGLSFMGKKWDYDVPSVDLWKEIFRVLKPGGHLLSFGGTRTYHRMVCAIEDAGFEIRDQIAWLYGSGFPKSHNIGNGFGTALKPANEPIVLARKPLSESTVAKNVLKHGTGALNIDASRIAIEDTSGRAAVPSAFKERKAPNGTTFFGGEAMLGQPNSLYNTQGRWPANLLLDETAAEMLGEPSRFFYCAKASKSERNLGLEGMPEKSPWTSFDGQYAKGRNPVTGERTEIDYKREQSNHHPTVKPIKLMEYLIRLITPPGGIVLDPFMGSGSTGVAAKNLGFEFIGIEMNEEYVEIAKKRIG